MLSKIKRVIVYGFSRYILILLLIILITFAVFPEPANLIISATLIISAAFFIIIFIRIRKKEMSMLIKTIKGIRENSFKSEGDIQLGNNLKELEDEIRFMFNKMNQDIEYLKKLERVRTEFLANVSHELRTPIFTIQGYLETLLDGALEDKDVNKKFLEKANQHTINLGHLVNDLIDISMFESGEMRMSFRYFNLSNFINEIINELHPLASKKNLELVFTPGREKLQVFGDKPRLKQVMVNLITNAIKYTDSGKVEIAVIEQGDYADVIVRDTGIGIPESELDRIFERFYRMDKARSKTEGGTGLGLAIVKHIIEAHGSRVKVKSRLNEGSEFSFHLKK